MLRGYADKEAAKSEPSRIFAAFAHYSVGGRKRLFRLRALFAPPGFVFAARFLGERVILP
jgi:hypothetical protein